MDFLTEQIQKMIDATVEQKFAEAIRLNTPKQIRKTNLAPAEAIVYLSENGYKCSLSQLYKLSMSGDIPLEKFGRKLLFNADALSKWIESRKTKSIDVAMCVAQSANSKLQAK
jgi:hypothetical protein